jgi:Family of unknown function (DUF6152)
MKRELAVLVATAALLPGAAAAHHSFAMFNRDQLTSITGVVKDYEWSNPHVWIHVIANDDKGVPREWGFEMQSIAQDSRAGWRPDSVKAGDKVTVEFHPLKDGSRGGQLTSAVLANGTRLGPPPPDGFLSQKPGDGGI